MRHYHVHISLLPTNLAIILRKYQVRAQASFTPDFLELKKIHANSELLLQKLMTTLLEIVAFYRSVVKSMINCEACGINEDKGKLMGY
jgi:hypothetical protein